MTATIVVMSIEDYVASRPGTVADDYDREIAEASADDACAVSGEMLVRALRQGLNPLAQFVATGPDVPPPELLKITREIMRERYDAEAERRRACSAKA